MYHIRFFSSSGLSQPGQQRHLTEENPPVLPSPVHHTDFSDRILFRRVGWKANKHYTILTLSEIPSK